jgi:hypothetical protein
MLAPAVTPPDKAFHGARIGMMHLFRVPIASCL